MAVSDNLGLYLPDREDYISVQRDLKSNYEIIDEHAGMVEDGIAIVINGDTAPRAISSGQYLLIKNHSTLATGGYHATANIANGASVTSSNVAADSDGIANALNSKIPSVVNNLTSDSTTSALSAAQGKALKSEIGSKAPYSLCSVEQKTTGSSSNVGAGSTVTQSVYAAISGKTILGIVGIVGGSYSSSCAISEYYISSNTAYVVWRNCSSSSINLGATKINILYRTNDPS